MIVVLALMTWRLRLDAALWLPFFMPGVLLGIALIWIFNRRGLAPIYQSAAIVILAYALRYAALGWNTVARAMRAGGSEAWRRWRDWREPVPGKRCATFIGRRCLRQFAAAVVCDLFAVPVGRGNAGVDRAAGRREPVIAHFQSAPLRP